MTHCLCKCTPLRISNTKTVESLFARKLTINNAINTWSCNTCTLQKAKYEIIINHIWGEKESSSKWWPLGWDAWIEVVLNPSITYFPSLLQSPLCQDEGRKLSSKCFLSNWIFLEHFRFSCLLMESFHYECPPCAPQRSRAWKKGRRGARGVEAKTLQDQHVTKVQISKSEFIKNSTTFLDCWWPYDGLQWSLTTTGATFSHFFDDHKPGDPFKERESPMIKDDQGCH